MAQTTRPKVGDRLVRKPINQRYAEASEVVVYKVGRKWGYARPEGKSYPDCKFDLDTGYEDAGGYSPHWRVLSPEGFEQEEHRVALVRAIKGAGMEFTLTRGHGITTDQLQQIAAVLNAEVSR